MPQTKGTNVAIFSRNWPKYLKAAAKRGANEPTTFRSKVRWVSAAKAIKLHGPRRIYFASIEGGGLVEFEADLVDVQLDPVKSNSRTRLLLGHELAMTEGEDLWDDGVQTLYVITNCRKIPTPFPQTRLHKVSDQKPIDANYIRSYALVVEL